MTATSLLFQRQVWLMAKDIAKRYSWKIPALVMLITITALGEGIGMILLLPLLTAVGIPSQPLSGLLGAVIDDIITAIGASNSPYHLAFLIVAVFALQLLLFLGQTWWISQMQRDYGAHWQKNLFSVVLRARWSFISNLKLGAITNQISQETIRLSGAFLVLTQFVAIATTAGVYIFIACMMSWQITLFMLGFAIMLFLAVRGVGRRSYKIGLRLGPLGNQFNVLLTEYLGGVKLIKVSATEAEAEHCVGKLVDELCLQNTLATFLPALVRAIFEFASVCGLCFLLVLGYRTFDIPAASMLVVLALFVRLLPRLNTLQQNLHILAIYVPAFTQAQQLANQAIGAAEEVVIKPVVKGSISMSGPLEIDIFAGGYDGVPILRDIKLLFPETGVVGIVGESGAGKSTLVNCLFGLADIQQGRVAFGPHEMKSVNLSHWRRQIGYVPQENVLFHLSIRDNIAWGHPYADDRDIEQVARQALAHQFIIQQPFGYATVIGDQGSRLSGGQRQRLGIARALLGRPRILVMDEATSALDSTSEEIVLKTVDSLRQNTCVVIVAHRLSTVRNADMIVVLNDGMVAETGNWLSLMAMKGVFFKLARAQHIE